VRDTGSGAGGGGALEGRSQPRNRVPGEAGVWLVIFGEMSVFAALFTSYLSHRAVETAVFAASQAELNKAIGLANTLLLLTSSLFVAMAVRATGRARTEARPDWAPRLFAAGLACGLAFIALKGVEYHALFARGVAVNSNTFFGFYFGLTALHLGHVVIGSALLGASALATRKPLARPSSGALIESAGCFWHMVDVLWIIIFALLYLVE
jgi:nitric oxide reductase NorE protein